MLLRHIALPNLILAAFVAALALWLILAEFFPRGGKRGQDDDDGAPLAA